MKKKQQTIECGRCAETRLESLSEEEMRTLNDAKGPIYRQCERCGRTTGWISAQPRPAAKEPAPSPAQTQPVSSRAAGSQPVRSQKRMATQADLDTVNSMVDNSEQNYSKD